MRKMLLLNLLLAALLALPAIALGDEDKALLRKRLSATVDSLAELSGIQKKLEARDAQGVKDILAASAPGPADAAQAEFNLMALRATVSNLLQQLDAQGLDQSAESHAPELADRPDAPIAQAESLNPPLPTPRAVLEQTAIEASSRSKTQFEADGFVADRARLGRACWRGGRYQEGVSALEPLAGNPQADYWRARCLEKLGRAGEALALYGKVIETAADSPEGRSAREDSEFLQWSMLHGLAVKP